MHLPPTYPISQLRRAPLSYVATLLMLTPVFSFMGHVRICAQSGAPVQTVPLNVSTYAGSMAGGKDGYRTDATFSSLTSVAFDPLGRLWISEGAVTGYADAAPGPHRIRMIDQDQIVHTIAGGDTPGLVDGAGSSARFAMPNSLAFDHQGNVFVADRANHRIRRIDPNGFVSTFAGSAAGFRDGTGTDAMLNTPICAVTDQADNLYVADFQNLRIRQITPAGVVTTYAGGTRGSQDGPLASATFDSPNWLASGPDGSLFVSDWSNGKIRKIKDGQVTTFASGISYVGGVSTDSDGNVYAVASGGSFLAKYSRDGQLIWTIPLGQGFQDGAIAAARFSGTAGPPVPMPDGNCLVADSGNNRIRLITVGVPASAAACVQTPSGLVGWWRGETGAEDLVSGIAGDIVGNLEFGLGEVGQGFGFDGYGGHISVPASSSLNVGAGRGFTIETWINPSDISVQRPIVEWNSGIAYGVHFWLSAPLGAPPGCLLGNLVDSAGMYHVVASAGGLLVANRWQHVALTYDRTGGSAALYVNGAVVSQTQLGSFVPQTSYNLLLGCRPAIGNVNSLAFAGQMDEVSIYSRALSEAEIAAIFDAGSAGKCKTIVPQPPVITAQPQDRTINPGGTATFSVTAQGTAPLTYQWRHEGLDIPGATADALLLRNVQTGDAGSYYVVVSNAAGSVVSQFAMLTVTSQVQSPVIVMQPQSQSASAGDTVAFTVTAQGAGTLTYQWLHNGALMSGATSPTLTLANIHGGDSGTYLVVVSNLGGSVTSQAANLAVSATPVNDPPTISRIPDQFTPVDTALAPVSFTIGDVDNPIDTLTLTASSSNTALVPDANIVLSGTGASRATALQPVSGQSGTTVITVSVSDGALTARTSFQLTVGTKPPRVVRIVNSTGAHGFDVVVPIELVAQGDENALGFSLQYDSSLLSAPKVKSPIAGAQLNVNSTQVSSGRLGVALALSAGQVISAGSREVLQVTFTMSPGTSADPISLEFTDQPIAKEVVDTAAGNLAATFQGGTITITAGYEADVAPRPNGSNEGRVTIADWVQVGRFASGLDTTSSASEFQRADCAPRTSNGTLVLGNGGITIADWVQAGRYAAGLDPVTAAGGPGGPAGAAAVNSRTSLGKMTLGTRVVRVGDAVLVMGQTNAVMVEVDSPGDLNAIGFSLSFDASAVRFVDAALGSGAPGAALNVNSTGADDGRIGIAVALPSGQTIAAGAKALVELHFSALVNGPETVTLSFADQPIAREVVGINADELSATFSNGSVTIQGAVGANTPPTISALPELISAQDGPALVSFIINDAETAPDALLVSVKSSNSSLVPDNQLLLGGSGRNRTLAAVPLSGQTGNAIITLTVTDAGGLSDSTSSILTVQGDPYAAWKARYFSSAQLAEPGVGGDDADPDGDGATNRQEYLAGTNPSDAQSVLKASIRTAPVVIWSSVPNLTYRVFRSISLTSTNWIPLSPLVTATDSTATFVDLETTEEGYYRVEVVP